MNRNRLLSISFAGCKILSIVLLVLFGFYTFVFIHWHIEPGYYDHVKIINTSGKTTSSLSMERISFTFTDMTATNAAKNKSDLEKVFTLGNLNYFSFYLFFVQAVSSILLSFLIIREIQQIIQSVQALDTFGIRNVKSFRKIGLYCFVNLLISAFVFAQTPEGSFLGLYFPLTPLGFMLGAYVLAEIFREGNKLYEEQQFTV